MLFYQQNNDNSPPCQLTVCICCIFSKSRQGLERSCWDFLDLFLGEKILLFEVETSVSIADVAGSRPLEMSMPAVLISGKSSRDWLSSILLVNSWLFVISCSLCPASCCWFWVSWLLEVVCCRFVSRRWTSCFCWLLNPISLDWGNSERLGLWAFGGGEFENSTGLSNFFWFCSSIENVCETESSFSEHNLSVLMSDDVNSPQSKSLSELGSVVDSSDHFLFSVPRQGSSTPPPRQGRPCLTLISSSSSSELWLPASEFLIFDVWCQDSICSNLCFVWLIVWLNVFLRPRLCLHFRTKLSKLS